LKTVAFFNNKGGVGKTSLVYHLAWMLADQGLAVLAVDLDPQANLTSMFLDDERLEAIWTDGSGENIYDCVLPLIKRTGDVALPKIQHIGENLSFVAGNISLSRFEDLLSESWPKCLGGEEADFRVMTAFHRTIVGAAKQVGAEVAFIDVGPNLGAINRSALIAADQVVLPLAPDLFSLQGLKNLGPTLRDWRKGWKKRLVEAPNTINIALPSGEMQPAGYVVMQHGVHENRPVRAYQKWMNRIPSVYRSSVLDELTYQTPDVQHDPHRLALLKHYRSLMPMAMDARKPMFHLKPSDGAIGAHVEAVRSCYADFEALAKQVVRRAGLTLPMPS